MSNSSLSPAIPVRYPIPIHQLLIDTALNVNSMTSLPLNSMLALLVPVSAFVLGILYLYIAPVVREYTWAWRIQRIMKWQGIRGPPPKFRVGNLLERNEMRKAATEKDMETLSHDIVPRLMPDYVHWSNLYGKRFLFWWGSEPRLVLHDMDEIRDVLSSKHVHSFGRSKLQREGVKAFIGEGLLMANGEAWAHQRRVVAPAFTVDKLKGIVGLMAECTSNMLQKWDEKIQQLERAQSANSKAEIEIEMSEQMSQLTADIIARTQFGSSYEEGKAIFEKLQELQKLSAQSSKRGVSTPRALQSRVMQLKVEMESALMSLIVSHQHAKTVNHSSTQYGYDLLGVMLSEIETAKGETNQFKFTLQQIMDECKTFFFTGHDTTALLLTWTLMLLASNQTWQDRVRKEILRITKGDFPNANMLNNMKELGMVLWESLRLYTPATLLAREAIDENVKVGKRGLYIPRGVSVWVPVLAIHHDKTIWGPDAHEFRPQRFENQPGLERSGGGPPSILSSSFLPFSCGPRSCVGQHFAFMEAKVVLSMILSHFYLRTSPSYRHAPIFLLTLKPKHGLPIILERIK